MPRGLPACSPCAGWKWGWWHINPPQECPHLCPTAWGGWSPSSEGQGSPQSPRRQVRLWGKAGGFPVLLEEMLPWLARRGSPFQSGCRPVPQFPSLRSERLSSERGVTRTISSPLPKPWGLGWLRPSPRGWLWGAHVSLCPTASSVLVPFKPPTKRIPSAPSLRAWLINAKLLTALALCYGHCLLPITLASGLPGKELPSPREALPLHLCTRRGRTAPSTPLLCQVGGAPMDASSLHPPPPPCLWLFGAHPAPPVPLQHPALLHLPLWRPCRDTLSPPSTPGCPAPRAPCQAPHDAGSFPPPGRAPASALAPPSFAAAGSSLKVRAGAGRARATRMGVLRWLTASALCITVRGESVHPWHCPSWGHPGDGSWGHPGRSRLPLAALPASPGTQGRQAGEVVSCLLGPQICSSQIGRASCRERV